MNLSFEGFRIDSDYRRQKNCQFSLLVFLMQDNKGDIDSCLFQEITGKFKVVFRTTTIIKIIAVLEIRLSQYIVDNIKVRIQMRICANI